MKKKPDYKEPKVLKAIRLDQSLADEVEKDFESFSSGVRWIIEEYYKNKKKKAA